MIGNEVKEISLNNDMSSSEKAVFAADTRAGATNQFTSKNKGWEKDNWFRHS